jgi:hypothetical protein
MTIPLIEIDIANCWDPGQAYVALSRATSLEGLRLLGYRRDRIKAHPRVLQYYDDMARKLEASKKEQVDVVVNGDRDAKKAKTAATNGWACDVCTSRNDMIVSYCTVCGEVVCICLSKSNCLINDSNHVFQVRPLSLGALLDEDETTPPPPIALQHDVSIVKRPLVWACDSCTHYCHADATSCTHCGEVPEVVMLFEMNK